ncbi:MAG: outer membrane beta-barrel protein [Pyrinomonadaceae bacterium]
MRKSIFMILFVVCSGSLCVAQTPEDHKNEFFAGYSYQSADINTLTIDPRRTSQNGVNVEYTRKVTRNVGITGDFSAHFHRDSSNTSGGTFTRKRDQYFLLGGLQFKAHNEKPVRPFAHALFGVSLFRGFTSNTNASSNVFTFDDATSFGMALGGGLDIRAGNRIDVRLFQVDYSPTYFGSGRQDNVRLSVGIIFKR